MMNSYRNMNTRRPLVCYKYGALYNTCLGEQRSRRGLHMRRIPGPIVECVLRHRNGPCSESLYPSIIQRGDRRMPHCLRILVEWII